MDFGPPEYEGRKVSGPMMLSKGLSFINHTAPENGHGLTEIAQCFCLFIYHFEITNKKIMKKSKYFIDPFFHNSTKSTLHIFHLKDKLPSRSIFSQFSIFKIQHLFLPCVKKVSELLKNIVVAALVKKLR